jgi:hypothetical protein
MATEYLRMLPDRSTAPYPCAPSTA